MELKLKPLHFYLIVFSIFLTICAMNLFSDGMFMDGVYYAAIAKNMANGIGSFWYPHFSSTLHNPFHEHPPLAFGIQAVFFYIFGNSILVERFYSLGTFIVCGILIVLIWKRITGESKISWLPLALWILIPKVWWACCNNILENTMSIFLCAAVLVYLASMDKHRYLMIVISGLCILLGFLSKGFTALYIWSLPFWCWVFTRKQSFFRMIADSLLLIASTVIPLLLLFLVSQNAYDSMLTYFNHQVMTSVKYAERVSTRFYIVYRMFTELLPVIVVSLSVIVFNRIKRQQKFVFPAESAAFFLLGLSGVLPIMITMKQSAFYINSTYPFFAIALGLLLKPAANDFVDKINKTEKSKRIVILISYFLIAFSLAFSAAQFGRTGKHKEKLGMIYDFIKIIPKNSVINIQYDLWYDWSLHGYFSRHANISLDQDANNKHSYYLDKSGDAVKPFKNMKKIKEVNGYVLYKLN